MEVISLSENCHFSKSPSRGQSYKKSYTRNFIHGIVNSTGAVKACAQLYKCLSLSVFPFQTSNGGALHWGRLLALPANIFQG
jgi:hypothetical protein